MPPAFLAILPVIAAITGIAGTGVGLGLELSNQPGSPNPNPTSAQNSAAIAQATQNRNAAVGQAQTQLPGLQESTSGGVSPGYLQDMSAINSGNPSLIGTSQLQQAIQSFLGFGGSGGGGSPGGSAPQPSMPNVGLPGLTPNVSPGVSNAASQAFGGQSSGLDMNNPFASATFGS